MKQEIRNNRYFYIPSILFLLVFGIYILSCGKETAFLKINHARNAFLDDVMPFITFLGDGWFAAVLSLVFFFVPLQHQLKLVFTWLFTFLIVTVLKNYIFGDALRPIAYFYERTHLVLHPPDILIHTSHSFPSGHTASAFAVFAVLASLTHKNIIKIIFFTAALLAGWSRIYLGQHFPEDVWMGAFIGLMVSLLFKRVFRKVLPPQSATQIVMHKFKKNLKQQ